MLLELVIEAHILDQIVQAYVNRGSSYDDALNRAIIDLEEIERILRQHHGPPEGATLRRRGTTGVWWLYSGALWVGLTRHERYDGFRPLGHWVTTLTVVAAGSRAGS